MVTETKITKDENVGQKIKADCPGDCGADKNHVVVSSIKEYGSDQDAYGNSYEWISIYQIIQCGGCGQYSFRRIMSNSEDFGPDGYEEDVDLYPNRIEGRPPVNDHALLPNDLQRIYAETLRALNAGLPVLAGVGIRAIVETVCKDKKSAGGDLYERIESLVTQQVLSRDGADILQKLRVMGNDAAHEVKPHVVKQLGFALDVIDNLVSSVYILPHHAKLNFD
jgi:Domain of unknown function (DUF4145)